MAESLNLLHHAQASHAPRHDSRSQGQPPVSPPHEQGSEIYHSLEDTVPYQQGDQPEQAPTPASTVSMAPRSVSGGNAPVTGQVCRFVAQPLLHLFAAPLKN